MSAPVLPTSLNPDSPEALARAAHNRTLAQELRAKVAVVFVAGEGFEQAGKNAGPEPGVGLSDGGIGTGQADRFGRFEILGVCHRQRRWHRFADGRFYRYRRFTDGPRDAARRNTGNHGGRSHTNGG